MWGCTTSDDVGCCSTISDDEDSGSTNSDDVGNSDDENGSSTGTEDVGCGSIVLSTEDDESLQARKN